MKLKLFFIVLVSLLASGCAEQVLAVPQTIVGGTFDILSTVIDAVIFWD